jgi:hypothetical protein
VQGHASMVLMRQLCHQSGWYVLLGPMLADLQVPGPLPDIHKVNGPRCMLAAALHEEIDLLHATDTVSAQQMRVWPFMALLQPQIATYQSGQSPSYSSRMDHCGLVPVRGKGSCQVTPFPWWSEGLLACKHSAYSLFAEATVEAVSTCIRGRGRSGAREMTCYRRGNSPRLMCCLTSLLCRQPHL